jgi:hypothetical protein
MDMNDFIKNTNSFPIRLNINMALDSEVESAVLFMNSIIVNTGFDNINFGKNGKHIPHITLLMGYVKNESSLHRIIERCESFASTYKPISYKISFPYWKLPSKNFIFVDTLPVEQFRNFRIKLYTRVGELVECQEHGRPENPSHITIGYSDAKNFQIHNIACNFNPPVGVGSVIRLCRAGYLGTCTDIFHKISLS